MNICQGFIECSRIFPDKTAISFEGQCLTYRELEKLSSEAGFFLKANGVNAGDRVAMILGNVPAFPVWYYAILRIGAIAVSVSPRLTQKEANFITSDCGAKEVVKAGTGGTIDVDENGSLQNRESLRKDAGLETFEYLEMEPDDPGIILYTSGTTGFPKGATLSHKNVRSTIHSFNHLCRMSQEDRLLLMVPLFHCYGQNALLNSGLNTGASIVLQRVFDPTETKDLILKHRITKLFGVPATFHLLLETCEPSDLASIDYCFSAAATLAPQLGANWLEKFGMPVYEGYGLTETAPFASYNHHLKHVPGSIGVPVDLVEMKVIDPETGESCPPGAPGEIIVRGPNVMLGYWNRPEETAEAVRDGWFYSGDVGKVDENGCFYIVDRIKDMISLGGMKVYPSEVEKILLDAPGVDDCAVVGLPDPVLGEEVAVFVVSRDSDAEAIRLFGSENLAEYKVPTKVIFVEELPRNPAGKVLKTELRKFSVEEKQDSLAEQLRSTHVSARERMLNSWLQESIRSLTGSVERPSLDTGILETGMDSLKMVTFAGQIRGALGSDIDLPATLLFDYPRIKDLSCYLLGVTGLALPVETSADISKDIESMSEEEAIEALRKELAD